MSAIVTIKGDDGVIVAFDTISYDMNGVILSTTACKLLPLIELNCVIGNVGVAGLTTALRHKIAARYADFDDLLGGVVEDLRELYNEIVEYYSQQSGPTPHATVVLAGWSAIRNRFETYRVSTREKEIISAGIHSTSPPFSLVATDGCWTSSMYRAEDCARFGIDFENESNFINLAVRIVCACRAASSEEGTGDFAGLPYGVGGQLQILLLQRNRITQWAAHSWPDEVGTTLDATAGDAMPNWLTEQSKAAAAATSDS